MEQSKGQALVGRMVDWLKGYLHFPDEDAALVVALWCVGTWAFERLYSFPYLAVTASVKGAGKTRVLECMRLLVRQGGELGAGVELTSGPTPAATLGLIAQYEGRFTLLWDEADAAASEKKGFLSEVLNSGYRQGQTIPRRSGLKVVEWRSYCPKAFALIGDLNNTVRDRAITVDMVRGKVARDFEALMATGVPVREGEALRADLFRLLVGLPFDLPVTMPEHLVGRDREIWTAIFTMAVWLDLDRATMGKLRRYSADNAGLKTADKRATTSYESETDALMAVYAESAIRDLRAVLKDGERAIFSSVAVERMRQIPTSVWRTFRGKGLDEVTLAALVKRFGLGSCQVRMHSGKGARQAKQLNGYKAADIRKASESVGGGV